MTELVDVYPTLADLCGLAAPDYLDGTSLRPMLNDTSATVKEAAFTQVRRGQNKHAYSIRTAKWRYTLWNDGADGEQLYDMERDPGEMRNLTDAASHVDVVKDLKARVRKYAGAR
jgi:arylsulfatase A-like enzyme